MSQALKLLKAISYTLATFISFCVFIIGLVT